MFYVSVTIPNSVLQLSLWMRKSWDFLHRLKNLWLDGAEKSWRAAVWMV